MFDIYAYFSNSISAIPTKDELERFLNKNGEFVFSYYGPEISYFNCLMNEVNKPGKVELLASFLDWAIKYNISEHLIQEFMAECIRFACNYNKVEIIEIIHRYNYCYEIIRSYCYYYRGDWDWECYHTSPLYFAVEADSYECFCFLLKWMNEENADINKEGFVDDIRDYRKSIIELLHGTGKEKWIP